MRKIVIAVLLLLAPFVMAQRPPATELGFKPERTYDFGGVDNVNVLNGNVIVNIPLGLTYPVAGDLSYGLSLVYNSKVWDYATVFENTQEYLYAKPGLRSNAGPGWRVSMGRLLADGLPGAQHADNGWIYEGSSGDEHKFGGEDPGATVLHSIGGAYLRMIRESSTRRRVEFPDGAKHTFEYERGKWRLKYIGNQFGDNVGVTYLYDGSDRTTSWTISDQHGRVHTVHFVHHVALDDSFDDGMNVSSIVYEGVGGATYTITFNYTDTIVAYGCGHSYIAPAPGAPAGTTLNLKLLTSVSLPDGSIWGLSYFTAAEASACSQGLVKNLTFPTRGKIEYTYQMYTLNDDACGGGGVDASSPGVATRTIDGNVWKYLLTRSAPVWPAGGSPGFPLDCGQYPEGGSIPPSASYRWTRTSVLSPPDAYGLRTRRDHYFNLWTAPVTGYDPLFNADDPALFEFAEAAAPAWPGLAAARLVPAEETAVDVSATDDGAIPSFANRSLSELVWSGCSETGSCASGTLLRSIYKRYKYLNQRLPVSERERFEDDDDCNGQTCWVQTDRSSFDFLGHHRTIVTSSNYPGDSLRTTYTGYPVWTTAQLMSSTTPWVLNTYTEQTRTAGAQTFKSTFWFDGFGRLRRTRSFAGASEQPHDIVTEYIYSGANLLTETSYGGDGGALGTSTDLSTLSLGTPRYKNLHTWSAGVLAQSRYVDPASGAGLSFLTLDLAIDSSTGLATAGKAVDGVATTSYEYEPWGRLKKMTPPGQTPTLFTFTNATASAFAKVEARRNADPASANDDISIVYHYDGMGRLVQQKELMPGATPAWTLRATTLDALGRVDKAHTARNTSTSDYDTAVAGTPATTYRYDGLGRVTQITMPDSSTSTSSYVGERLKSRTSSIATPSSSTTAVQVTEEYDAYGRLVKITEPSGPTTAAAPLGADVVTEYRYDAADHLVSVKMKAPDGVIQDRVFDYDGRGFLRWESQPESGMKSYAYDARGHVVSKTHGAAATHFDLNYIYDSAERLVRIDARNPFFDPADPVNFPQFRVLKEFQFGTSNDGTDYRNGKLISATRYNYDDGDSTYKIRDEYRYDSVTADPEEGIVAYDNPAGWLRSKKTVISETTWFGNTVLKQVEQSVERDTNGMLKTVRYPICNNCGGTPTGPSRSVQYTYAAGRLQSVPGYIDSLSYWPNGMRNVQAHSNGIADTQTVGAMDRPTQLKFGTYDHCVRPVFTTHPVNAEVPSTPGATVRLTVLATGSPTYEWFKDGVLVGTGSFFDAGVGEYSVRAQNSCGFVLSQTAIVTTQCVAPATGVITASVQPDGSWILRPNPTARSPRSFAWRRMPEPETIATTETLTVPALSETTTYRLTIEDGCGSSYSEVTIKIRLAAPQGLTASWSTSTPGRIVVDWNAVAGATGYVVERRSGAEWTVIGGPAAPSFIDTTVVAGHTYAYRVYASAGTNESDPGVSDVATTRTFTEPVEGGSADNVTAVTEMLNAVNSVRAAAGWPAVTWTNILAASDPVPAPGQWITARQIVACRIRMNEARLALGAAVLSFHPPELDLLEIRAAYIRDVLRAAW
ncbi:MAG TPA: hypothetical protein VEK79_06265 [Thermoanaerobaculia bacterium]|nr:hypothetical protein [Thermoanaerobaculia bacterium]